MTGAKSIEWCLDNARPALPAAVCMMKLLVIPFMLFLVLPPQRFCTSCHVWYIVAFNGTVFLLPSLYATNGREVPCRDSWT